MKNLKDKIKHHWKEVLRIKTTDHEIALGFAVGTFIVILPTPGFSILLGLLIVLLYKKISKIALFLAFAVWNPFVMIPIYGAAYAIGSFLFSGAPTISFEIVILDQIYQYTRRFAVGLVILSICFSSISYVLIRTVLRFRKK